MRPKIEDTWFGSITIDGERFEHDVIIRLSGKIRRRKKELSKEMYGTSHKISLAEVQEIYRPHAEWLIIGTGQEDQVRLSQDAAAYLDEKKIKVSLLPTAEAARAWNQAEGKVLGLFHITC